MAVSAATLRTLHRIHRQLTDLRSRLLRGPKQIKAGEANLAALTQKVEDAKQEVQKTRILCDQKELQLKEREARIETVRTKLNVCSSNREYQALLEQIAADEQANSVLSDEILELFDKVTSLQDNVKQREDDRNTAQAEFEKRRAAIEGEKQSLEADVARLSNELQEQESKLPADVRQDYDRLVGGRGESGLAVLEADCCGHCNQTINPQMLNELLLERLTLCKSCGAILYLPEDREPKRREDQD